MIPQRIQQSKGGQLAYPIAGVIVLIGFITVFLYSQFRTPSISRDLGAGTPKQWFTTDDGKTWFAGDASQLPPFEHDGKTAYGCYVWTCDGGKTMFVSYLERLKPDAKQRIESANGNLARISEQLEKTQVKLPLTGNTGWVDSELPGAMAIKTPKSPPGEKLANLQSVRP